MSNKDVKHGHTMKRCPFCGQKIHHYEIKCEHCGGWSHFAEPFFGNIITDGSDSKIRDFLDNLQVPTFLRKSIQAVLERKHAAKSHTSKLFAMLNKRRGTVTSLKFLRTDKKYRRQIGVA